MNLSISWERGVYLFSAELVKLAILPIAVSSPVLKTMPTPLPIVHEVPEKATLGDSNALPFLSSGFLKSSSASPVKDALFTFSSLV